MSVSRRLWARTGMLVIAGVCLLGATPASAEGRQPAGRALTLKEVLALAETRSEQIAIARAGVARAAEAELLARRERRLQRAGLAFYDVSVAAGGIGTTPGRRRAIVAAAVGLISVVIGGLALARSAGRIGTGSGRLGAVVALVVGLIGLALSGLHLAGSTGGIGTGSGRLGAIVALVVGLIGMVLGGLALARSRRTADRLTD